MGLLVAGTKYRGEFEERLKKLMDEIKQNEDIILVRGVARVGSTYMVAHAYICVVMLLHCIVRAWDQAERGNHYVFMGSMHIHWGTMHHYQAQ